MTATLTQAASDTVLLESKFTVPLQRPDVLPRGRLLEQLTRALDGKLTLISAPAGFGKTTLLSEWVADRDRPAAWLTLDEGDNDPARFLAYLLAALQTVDPTVGHDILPIPLQAGTLEGPLTVLVNQLDHAPPLVLALDDYHVITSATVHNAVSFLVEHSPAQLHLAIGGRADPPLPLARWRAHGQLVEVRADELQFTVAEAREFFAKTMGLQLNTDHSAALQARTEGWVAGMQLAGLLLQGRQDVASFVAAFGGSNRYVLDYLLDEVMSQQPEDLQTFLLRTSVLSRLSGSLCDAVVGPEMSVTGETVLPALEAANLFIVPLDDNQRWYRYRHLFAEFLQVRLRQTEPQLLPELHRRAAEWYVHNGLQPEAIEHALHSEDPEYAACLIEQTALDLQVRGEFATIRRWLEALPADVVKDHPPLCVFYGWALLDAFEMDHAMRWLDRPSDVELPDHLRLLRGAVQTRVYWLQGELERAIQSGRGALAAVHEPMRESDLRTRPDRAELPPTLDGRVRRPSLLEGSSAFSAELRDNRFRAYLSLFAATYLAEALRIQGQLRQAIQIYRDALQGVQHIDPDTRLLTAHGFAEVGLGRLLYEQNELDEAERHLTRGIELAHAGGNDLFEALSCTFLAPVRQAQGHHKQAVDLLDRAEAMVRRRGVSKEITYVTAQRVRLARADANIEIVAKWAAGYRPSIDEQQAHGSRLGYIEEFADSSYVRALLALGRTHEAARLIERLLAAAETSGQTGWVIEMLILAAQACEAGGETPEALAALERALVLAEPEGYVRTIADEGPSIGRLLATGSRCFTRVSQTYIRRLLEVVPQPVEETTRARAERVSSAGSPARNGSVRGLPEQLTGRELEVLQLMASGLHNIQIADRLAISIGTVERHTGNIYGKLGVETRTQAILRAGDLGLV